MSNKLSVTECSIRNRYGEFFFKDTHGKMKPVFDPSALGTPPSLFVDDDDIDEEAFTNHFDDEEMLKDLEEVVAHASSLAQRKSQEKSILTTVDLLLDMHKNGRWCVWSQCCTQLPRKTADPLVSSMIWSCATRVSPA